MSSVRETALVALVAALSGSMLGTVRRADGTDASVPSIGALVTVHDGSLEAEPLLSPLTYAVEHTVPIAVTSTRRSELDNALQAIAAVALGDQTLGGAVDWLEVGGPDAEADEQSQGQLKVAPLFTGQISVTLFYTAPTAAG